MLIWAYKFLLQLQAKYENTRQEHVRQNRTGVNLYIKNLSKDINDERLRNEFIVFGNITSAKVMLNSENNASKGFGFVCFSEPDDAIRAISEMNGKVIDGKSLYVGLAQKKADRVQHLRSQHQQQPPPAVLNQTMKNFIKNPKAQRVFVNHPSTILQNIWLSYAPQMTLMQHKNQHILNQLKMPDTKSQIANAHSMEAKQLLGEKIFPLASKHAGDMAGRVTAMLLELDNAELLYMIENENALRMKVGRLLWWVNWSVNCRLF